MSKVLLVNDCRFESVIMKDMISSLGCEVWTATEYDAIRKIGQINPDILVCNLIMKETKGNVLIERVKMNNPNIKCFLSSSNDISLNEYKTNNVDGVIKTPVTVDTIKHIFEEKNFTKTLSKKRFSFCPFCGENLSKLKTNLVFCPFCGGKVE